MSEKNDALECPSCLLLAPFLLETMSRVAKVSIVLVTALVRVASSGLLVTCAMDPVNLPSAVLFHHLTAQPPVL